MLKYNIISWHVAVVNFVSMYHQMCILSSVCSDFGVLLLGVQNTVKDSCLNMVFKGVDS
jgi:hypothetical protein